MLTLLAFVAAASAQPTLRKYQQSLNDCMALAAIELGAFNDMPVDAVIHAAEGKCQPEFNAAIVVWNRLAWPGRRGFNAYGVAYDVEQADRNRAYLAAFEALAQARKGTGATPGR